VRGEAVGALVGKEAHALASNEFRENGGCFDRRGLDPGIPLEDAFDHSLILLLFQAARRVEQEAAGREKARRGEQGLLLCPREPFDRVGPDPIADFRVLPEGSGSAARRIQQDALETTLRQGQRSEVSAYRTDRRDSEAVDVLAHADQSLQRAVDGEALAETAGREGRERLAAGGGGQIDQPLPRRQEQREQLRPDVLDAEVAFRQKPRAQRIPGENREGERRERRELGRDVLRGERGAQPLARGSARIDEQVEEGDGVVLDQDPAGPLGAEPLEPARDEKRRMRIVSRKLVGKVS